MKPTLSKVQYEAHYGLTMEQCMQKDKMLTQRGYVAISIRVFNNGRAVSIEIVSNNAFSFDEMKFFA